MEISVAAMDSELRTMRESRERRAEIVERERAREQEREAEQRR